jgi:hypothetical protein
MKKLLLAALFLLPSLAFAQAPDCQFSVTFTGAGRQGTSAAPAAPTAFPALSSATGTPCVSWHITYQTIGAVTVSLSFQGVNDNGLTPGSTFTTMGGACPSTNPCTLITGTNPMTDAVNSYLAVTGYYPWVSLLMNTCTSCSSTNTVVVKGIGFRAYNAVESVTGSTVTIGAGTSTIGKVDILGNAGAILDNAPGSTAPANALQIGYTDGTNLRVPYADPCLTKTWTYYVINVTVNTQIVAGVASNNVYVCQFFLAPVPAAANVNIVESATSGNACATSPTGMMGGATAALGANLGTNGGFVLAFANRAWMKTATSGDAMCIFTSAQVSGVLAWVQNNP